MNDWFIADTVRCLMRRFADLLISVYSQYSFLHLDANFTVFTAFAGLTSETKSFSNGCNLLKSFLFPTGMSSVVMASRVRMTGATSSFSAILLRVSRDGEYLSFSSALNVVGVIPHSTANFLNDTPFAALRLLMASPYFIALFILSGIMSASYSESLQRELHGPFPLILTYQFYYLLFYFFINRFAIANAFYQVF